FRVALALVGAARDQRPLLGGARPDQQHAAALCGVVRPGVPLDRLELRRREERRHAPPASAGMIDTSSPSLSRVAGPCKLPISSPFTYRFTWWCIWPVASRTKPRRPSNRLSRVSSSSFTSAASTSTRAALAVARRNGVGMYTLTAMAPSPSPPQRSAVSSGTLRY